MKKQIRVLAFLISMVVFISMIACVKQPETTTNSQTETSSEVEQTQESESTGNKSEKIKVKEEDQYWATDSREYTVAVRVTINPDAMLYLNGEEVIGVAFLNEDARNIYDTGWMLSRNYKDVLYDMFKGAQQFGVLKEDGQIKVEVVETVGIEEPFDYIYDYPVEALQRVETETNLKATVLLDERNEDEWADYKETEEHKEKVVQSEIKNDSQEDFNGDSHGDFNDGEPNQPSPLKDCVACNGTGTFTCPECGGSGESFTIEEHEELVRNDFVCPTCGGKGWIDDGMHGGETAECGYCTTNGGSGDFRERAYDVVIVEEQVPCRCQRCGGSGRINCSVCEGTGFY